MPHGNLCHIASCDTLENLAASPVGQAGRLYNVHSVTGLVEAALKPVGAFSYGAC